MVFFRFSLGFLMNCEGIASQLSKHSSRISITLPKRVPSVFLRLSIEFRFQQDSNFTTILLRFQLVFYYILYVFIRFSNELWGNRLPTFKAVLKNFYHFAKEVSFSFLKTFNWISLPASIPTSPRLCLDFSSFPKVFFWFFQWIVKESLANFQSIPQEILSLCQTGFLQFS